MLLTTCAKSTPRTCAKKLSEAGLPNLWIPKIVKQIETMPILGTGKLDLQRCKEIAAK